MSVATNHTNCPVPRCRNLVPDVRADTPPAIADFCSAHRSHAKTSATRQGLPLAGVAAAVRAGRPPSSCNLEIVEPPREAPANSPAATRAAYIAARSVAGDNVWTFDRAAICRLARTDGYGAVLCADGFDANRSTARWFDDLSVVVTCSVRLPQYDDHGDLVVTHATIVPSHMLLPVLS